LILVKLSEEARAAFLDVLQASGQVERPVQNDSSSIDLNKREQRDYSVVRAIRACVNNSWNEAGLEREVSDTLAKQIGRETQGFFIPHNIPIATRTTQTVGSYSTGGALVAENLLPASFIDLLRNTAIITQLGPTVLTGLTGNVSIPRQKSASTMYWVAEDAAVTQSGTTYDNMTLMPKQAGVLSRITRLAMPNKHLLTLSNWCVTILPSN
jgi:HK97 family phage major capsid protein